MYAPLYGKKSSLRFSGNSVIFRYSLRCDVFTYGAIGALSLLTAEYTACFIVKNCLSATTEKIRYISPSSAPVNIFTARLFST